MSTPTATLGAPAPARAVAERPSQSSVQVLTFTEPLPGFPGLQDYVLVPADPGGLVFWLQSVAPAGPRFLAVPASGFFPDYAPTLPGAACVELGLEDPREAYLLCLVTVLDGDVASATANLRAPVVVNPATSRARQMVLSDGRHPIRRQLRR